MNSNNNRSFFLILWFPHSGCRWLNRSLLSNNKNLVTTEFYIPWLTQNTDSVLQLDRTAQVHKARSIKSMHNDFKIVQQSVEYGRKMGIEKYFNLILDEYSDEPKVIGGPLSPGAPEPLIPDVDLIQSLGYNVKFIHLVRSPVNCFGSMKSRLEMDGDPYTIASLWAAFNCKIRRSFVDNPENYFLLKYEDLVANTEVELKKLCSWLDVEFENEMLSGIEEYHGRNRSSDVKNIVDPSELDVIKELAGKEASHYNYEI